MDLELTCWPDVRFDRKQEIIEIGIVVFDTKTYSTVAEIERFVKPMYSEVNDYCTSITGIVQEDLLQSKNLNVEIAMLLDGELPDPKEFVWCCWGHDPVWLQNELISKTYKRGQSGFAVCGTPYKLPDNTIYFDPRWINTKLIAGGGGMKKGARRHGIEQVLPAHRALSDAKTVALIAQKVGVSALDVQVSNKRTEKQRRHQWRKDVIAKFVKRMKVDETLAEEFLKQNDWNYQQARNSLELCRKYASKLV